jgi:hypothetical protein
VTARHVDTTFAAHVIRLSKTSTHVSCHYRFHLWPKPPALRWTIRTHGQIARFSGPNRMVVSVFCSTPSVFGRASNVPSPPLVNPGPLGPFSLAWSRPLPPHTPVKGITAFTARNAFHRRRPRRAFPASLDSHRAPPKTTPFASDPGLFPLDLWLGGFNPRGFLRHERPPPQRRTPTSAVRHDPRTQSAASDPCTPLGTQADTDPKIRTRLDRRRTEEPPHRKRSSRAPPDNQPDTRCHPSEPREIGKTHATSVGSRLRVQRPPRRGTPSNETRCLPPSATPRTCPSLAAGFHVGPFETPASTGSRFGLLPTRSPGLRHFYLCLHGHLGG